MNDNYLIHYGVIGMRWGIRRSSKSGTNYRYKSMGQKHYDKKVEKLSYRQKTGKTKKEKKLSGEQLASNQRKLSKASSKRRLYQQRDLNREMYVRRTNSGKSFVRAVLVGGINNGAYSRYRAAGESRIEASLKTGLGLLGVTATGLLAVPVVVGVSRHNEFKQAKKQILRHDSLTHWGTKEDHKYIAKVERSDGSYRYFYDKGEYEAYLVNNNPNEWNFVSDSDSNLDPGVARNIHSARLFLEDAAKFVTKGVGGAIVNPNSPINLPAKKAEEFILDVLPNVLPKNDNSTKYIAKVDRPDGSYRYFYDQYEYDAYLSRQKYQQNEPDFMKNVPKLSVDYYSMDDLRNTNPKIDLLFLNSIKNDDERARLKKEYSTNCQFCSYAYELRKRGYDVTARPNDGSADALKRVTIPSSRSSIDDDEFADAVENGIMSKCFENPDTKPVRDLNKLEDTLRKNNPPNSRGQLSITWKDGGGHSVIYEVDSKGDVSILDSQRWIKHDPKDLAKYADRIVYTRTDNLKIKETILATTEEYSLPARIKNSMEAATTAASIKQIADKIKKR